MPERAPTSPSLAFGLLTVSAVLWLAGCTNKPVTENAPPPPFGSLFPNASLGEAPESLRDWSGTYQAVLPCNGCPGIALSVQLRGDQTALVRQRRLGSDIEVAPAQTYNGPFRFEPPGGRLITLSNSAQESPAYRFLVAEGWIEMRERHTGAALQPTTMYRLRKTSLPVQ